MSGIGWYVHHHGRGHLTRFEALRPHLPGPVVVFSSLEPPAYLPEDTRWVVLPRDDDRFVRGGEDREPREADPTVGDLLHWAPKGHPGHRERLSRIAVECVAADLEAFVVDVSVEVTLWVRLLGIPTVKVTQPGERSDEAHALAYRAADRILAPWPAGAMSSSALEPFADRVEWVGGVSRFGDRGEHPAVVERSVLVLGPVFSPEILSRVTAEAADAGWAVTSLGADAAGWRPDPWEALCSAAVVVSAAGQNSVADLAAARARAVVVPQPRPFDEQLATADALERAGLAVVEREVPQPGEFVRWLERALLLQPDWNPWRVSGAAARAAEVVRSVTA